MYHILKKMHFSLKKFKLIAINEQITQTLQARHAGRHLCKLEKENNQEYYNDDR